MFGNGGAVRLCRRGGLLALKRLELSLLEFVIAPVRIGLVRSNSLAFAMVAASSSALGTTSTAAGPSSRTWP